MIWASWKDPSIRRNRRTRMISRSCKVGDPSSKAWTKSSIPRPMMPMKTFEISNFTTCCSVCRPRSSRQGLVCWLSLNISISFEIDVRESHASRLLVSWIILHEFRVLNLLCSVLHALICIRWWIEIDRKRLPDFPCPSLKVQEFLLWRLEI